MAMTKILAPFIFAKAPKMPSPPTVPLAQLPPYAAAIQYMVAATVSPIMLTPSAYLDLFCQLVQRDQYILALHNRFGLPLPPTLFMTPTVNNQSHNLITQTAQTSAGTAPTTPPEPSDDLPWLDITPGSVDSSEVHTDLLTGNGKHPPSPNENVREPSIPSPI